MGVLILIVATLVEIILMGYYIKTKSNNLKTRSFVRIGELITFTILVLISVIKWSFRWYLIFALLLIWTLLSCYRLISKRFNGSYGLIRTLMKGVASSAILAVTLSPAIIFPQYTLPETTGNHTVATADYTFVDINRTEKFKDTGENRKVTINIWYPSDKTKKYPLVLFSHGAFGVSSSNTSTFMDLASNGYLVCSLSHPYHSMVTIDTDGGITLGDKVFRQEVIDANNGVYDNEKVYELEREWLKLRTDDLNFIIDTIKEKAKSNTTNQVFQNVDITKIGLFGHSLGGAAAVQLGRDREDIDAVANLDADLLGEYIDYKNNEFIVNTEVYPAPLLSIYSDDMKRLFDKIDYSKVAIPQKIITDTAPNAYEVFINGTNHMSLTDLPLFSPFIANMLTSQIEKVNSSQIADKFYVIETMNGLIIEYFNCFLKGKGSFNIEKVY